MNDPTNQRIRGTYVNESILNNLAEEGRGAQKRLLGQEADERYFVLTRRLAEAAPGVAEEGRRRAAGAPATMRLAVAPRAPGASRRSTSDSRQGDWPRPCAIAATTTTRTKRARVYTLAGDAAQSRPGGCRRPIRWGFPCYPLFAEDHMLDPVRKSPAFQRVP